MGHNQKFWQTMWKEKYSYRYLQIHTMQPFTLQKQLHMQIPYSSSAALCPTFCINVLESGPLLAVEIHIQLSNEIWFMKLYHRHINTKTSHTKISGMESKLTWVELYAQNNCVLMIQWKISVVVCTQLSNWLGRRKSQNQGIAICKSLSFILSPLPSLLYKGHMFAHVGQFILMLFIIQVWRVFIAMRILNSIWEFGHTECGRAASLV